MKRSNLLEKIELEWLKTCIKLQLYWLEFMDKFKQTKDI